MASLFSLAMFTLATFAMISALVADKPLDGILIVLWALTAIQVDGWEDESDD